jgi:ABC-2 type transport system permease protein
MWDRLEKAAPTIEGKRAKFIRDPGVLRPVAALLPTTHAFAAGRQLVDGGPMPWGQLTMAAAGTLVAVAGALALVAWMLRLFRRRGYITRYS